MARILVVDDDADHRAYVTQLVERLGHSAIAAENGRAGLSLLSDTEVDTIITDIFMPEADGIELVKALSDSGSHTPVIGMTGGFRGMTQPYEKLFAFFAGAQVLKKPFGAKDLATALEEALNNVR